MTNATPKLDRELIAEAESLGIDVSTVLETDLRRRVEKERVAKAWADENCDAIESFNRYIEEYGPFGEEFRQYG